MQSNLNYGVIGNSTTAALISDKGSIEWLCFPYFDSPSVFASLLDKQKGNILDLKCRRNIKSLSRTCRIPT